MDCLLTIPLEIVGLIASAAAVGLAPERVMQFGDCWLRSPSGRAGRA